jgi:hypothetical protein
MMIFQVNDDEMPMMKGYLWCEAHRVGWKGG